MNSPCYSQAAGLVRRKIKARRGRSLQLRVSRNGGREVQTPGELIGDTVLSGDRNSTYAAPFIRECLQDSASG